MTDEFTPEVLERLVVEGLKHGDARCVHDALLVLAVRDPERAERLHRTILVGLDIAREARQ